MSRSLAHRKAPLDSDNAKSIDSLDVTGTEQSMLRLSRANLAIAPAGKSNEENFARSLRRYVLANKYTKEIDENYSLEDYDKEGPDGLEKAAEGLRLTIAKDYKRVWAEFGKQIGAKTESSLPKSPMSQFRKYEENLPMYSKEDFIQMIQSLAPFAGKVQKGIYKVFPRMIENKMSSTMMKRLDSTDVNDASHLGYITWVEACVLFNEYKHILEAPPGSPQ